ncbi:MAG: hypothetical protein LQ342_004336 [Letrouitia transgressa]|nr:MAG: hypothetical protein LQ342_004336 [Letrouitia transgressa]
MNASPPMTPPTIAPVLLVGGAGEFGAFGMLGFEGKAPGERTVVEDGVGLVGDEETEEDVDDVEKGDDVGLVGDEEIEEDVDDGEKGDGSGREEGVARDVEDLELGVIDACKCSVPASAAQVM